MKISIIGAGLSGLLAANILHRHKPHIYEQQPSLPNNHSAVLRFRSPIIGDVLGIPFKKVTMIKTVLPWRNPVADALAYSYKTTETYLSDRSVVSSSFVREDRYIAPPGLISLMSGSIPEEQFHFGDSFFDDCDGSPLGLGLNCPIISTIPMPALMKALDYKDLPKEQWFNHKVGVNLRVPIYHCDAYVSLYVTSPEYDMSRLSLTGGELIIEYPTMTREQFTVEKIELEVQLALHFLGMDDAKVGMYSVSQQAYHKIMPIDDNARKDFMSWATRQFNIYSLGRYATWRPTLLLDDLVQDIRLIEKWMSGSSAYEINRRK